jgi:hypothetical protein
LVSSRAGARKFGKTWQMNKTGTIFLHFRKWAAMSLTSIQESPQPAREKGVGLVAVERVRDALGRASAAITVAELWLASAALACAERETLGRIGKWGDAWRNQPRVHLSHTSTPAMSPVKVSFWLAAKRGNIIRPSQLGGDGTHVNRRPAKTQQWRRQMAQGKMYIPEGIPELVDQLVSMRLGAPKFMDQTGYMPFINLDYCFRQLNEGLASNRRKIGEERYQTLMRMSGEIRALFEADPEDKTGETRKGRETIHEMVDILRQIRRKP